MATSCAGDPVKKQGPTEDGWSKGMHLRVAVVSSFTLFSSPSDPAQEPSLKVQAKTFVSDITF